VGLAYPAYRSRPLLRRIPACLRKLRVRSVGEAWARLRTQPGACAEVVDTALLGVTQFCRDTDAFRYLRDQILPSRPAEGRRWRVWSAACSAGPELYSVAILLAERGGLSDAFLVGTDVRPSAIAAARAGYFPADMLNGAPREWPQRYFVGAGGGRVRAVDTLRQGLHWQEHDLLGSVLPGPWDVILWRNMAMYLTDDAADRLWRNLVGALARGGHLIVGRAEQPPPGLPLLKVARCIYRRRGD
jgi:chemotaxis protein methyltransferase CheR